MNPLDSNPLAFAGSTAVDEDHAPQDRIPWPDRVSQQLVLRAFEGMTRGSLSLRLPDGSAFHSRGGGPGPQAEIQVHRSRFFRRCALHGDIGFGEAYQDGDWSTP
ncbi:MAG: hypothetical protein JNL10_07185, partial [Verrucomicrobiales bacterium]|nr:hypothetical protein [Verrucomicrobiales bacterium]